MHKFHTLQCMNNKLLLSNHHFLWPNIHTLRGRHLVSVMVNTLFLKYTSCCSTSSSSLRNMPPATTHLKIFRPGQPSRLSACHLSMQHNHGLIKTVLCMWKKIGVQNRIPSIMFIKPSRIHLKGIWNSSPSKFCRSTSCYLVKHNLVMAPKASLTYMPTTQVWRPLALAPPSFLFSSDLSSSRFSTFQDLSSSIV